MDKRFLPEDSVLCPTRDEQLIKGLEGYARVAGIGGHPEYIWQSIKETSWVDKEDQAILKMLPFKNNGHCGVAYLGYSLSRMSKKFMILTGFLTRTYADARYRTRISVINDLKEGLEVPGKVLFIPDWYVSKSKSRSNTPLAQWVRDLILSFLLDTQAEGRNLYLGIHDWGAAEEHYGEEIMAFIEDNFIDRK